MLRRHLMLGLALTPALAPTLAPTFARAQEAPPIPVVASFSILADMVRQIGGDAVSVTGLRA
jgi:zinc/manganese transport system substrate-binding protein